MNRYKRFSISLLLIAACMLLIGLTASPARAEEKGAAKATTGTLIVTKAVYGDLPDGEKTDVTEKVAGMVKDGYLLVKASNDNFDDPANGVAKKLRVDYTLAGEAKSVTTDENMTIVVGKKKIDPSRKLVITKAVYGDLPSGTKVDVTDVLDSMVKDNALNVDVNNDNFGDPVSGVGKKMQVEYTFDGAKKSKTVDEDKTLEISNTGE